ncbi:MAG: outer membrane beta-barrel protein [Pirellulales bacterium]|nr:outer membrane beta-barrel protein [Pirellulales bacterium]
MPARLILNVVVSGVAAMLLLGGSSTLSVRAQSPPDVPETRLMSDEALPVTGEQSTEKTKLLSSEFPDSSDTDPPDCNSPLCTPPACGPSCGRLGEGHLIGRLNFFPQLCDYMFNPPERHRGMGLPLTRESWLYRPFGLGGFIGFINGGTLIDDWTGSDSGTLYGFRLSWDPGYYWGCEFRYGFTSMGRWDSTHALTALAEDNGIYYPGREVDMELWNCSLLWYPWGDSTWRPYWLVGLGGAKLRFDDCFANHWAENHFAMPLALGLKYRYNSRLAFRFEMADNIVFSSGQVNAVHHFTITGGLELRFGGARKAYWPWSPGRYYW